MTEPLSQEERNVIAQDRYRRVSTGLEVGQMTHVLVGIVVAVGASALMGWGPVVVLAVVAAAVIFWRRAR